MRALLTVLLLFVTTTVWATDRTVCDSGCAHTTIAACNTAASAGDVCLVYQNYSANESFETTKGGTSNDVRLTFRGVGATVQHFRIRHPYVTVQGFDLTGYTGLNAAYIRIEPEGDNCEILGNTFRDGIYLSSEAFAFDNAAETITHAAGGFLAAGFEVGATVYFASFADEDDRPDNHDNNVNDGTPDTFTFETRTIATVTDTVITLTSAADLWTESGVIGTLYVSTAEKIGVYAILQIDSSVTGEPTGCLIQGNHFTNLAGRVLSIVGSNTVITQNRFDQLGGWRLLSFAGGNNNVFSYNTFTDSPRWPNFIRPTNGFLTSAGGGTWDMYDTIFESQMAADTDTANDNRIEYNFIQNVDEQFSNITSYTDDDKADGLRFRYNVFVGVQMVGSLTRPNTLFEHNTFYGSATESAHNINFGYSTIGPSDPAPTIIRSNAFVASGDMVCAMRDGSVCTGTADADDKAARGWYNNDDGRPASAGAATPGLTGDYNFVTGSAADGWPAKDATFTAEGFEVHGVNGGDPRFMNVADPLGPDGVPFTPDDGLQPRATSPLCGVGYNGEDIGAYACLAAESSTLKRVCTTGAPTCTYTTIQACADGAATGVTCLVDAGTYNERVDTNTAGVSFKAHGVVTMKGFEVKHSNVTIDGFDMTGHTVAFQSLIMLFTGGSYPGAYFTTIINNTFRDTCLVQGNCGTPRVGGIKGVKDSGGGVAPHDIVVRNNTLTNLNYIYLQILGEDWLLEGNRLSINNNYDFFHVQGSDVVIRRNIVGPSSQSADTGNHPDFVQTFDADDGSASAENVLVEENFVYSLHTAEQQLTQMNNSIAGTNGQVDDINNFTFRRNVFAGVMANVNTSVPYVTYEQNTFYRVGMTADGIGAGGFMSRGSANNFTLRNNVILGNGTTANTTNATGGFYAPTGQQYSVESVNLLVTMEYPTSCSGGVNCPNAALLYDDLEERGYIDVSGYPTAAARALTSEMDYGIDVGLVAYKTASYTALQNLITAYDLFVSTFVVHNNYASGAPSSAYLAKRADACNCGATYTRFRFCEVACSLEGINGGDPKLQAGTRLTRGALAIPYVSAGTWDATAKTLTKTGAFASYTIVPGDLYYLYNPSTFTSATYTVVSKTNDVITLGTLQAGRGPGIPSNATNIVAVGITPDADILGPDGVPFTLDDGLKPRVGSFLCAADSNGKDIGAYACASGKVLETSIGKPTSPVVK